jgi:hypothetical protein
MTQVGFEIKTPAFERAKTVHALALAAIVLGYIIKYSNMKLNYN